MKRRQQQEKQEYQRQVLEQTKLKQQQHVNELKSAREQKEHQLKMVYQQRDWQNTLKRELEMLKREERLENV